MNINRKYFWILIIVLYCIGVLALIGSFLMVDINANVAVDVKKTIIRALVVGIPPILFPIYKFLKK